MIVYGDSEFRTSWNDALDRLHKQFRATDAASLDDLRIFLIQAGQIEHAAGDAGFDDPVCAVTEAVTDSAQRRHAVMEVYWVRVHRF